MTGNIKNSSGNINIWIWNRKRISKAEKMWYCLEKQQEEVEQPEEEEGAGVLMLGWREVCRFFGLSNKALLCRSKERWDLSHQSVCARACKRERERQRQSGTERKSGTERERRKKNNACRGWYLPPPPPPPHRSNCTKPSETPASPRSHTITKTLRSWATATKPISAGWNAAVQRKEIQLPSDGL